GDDGRTVLEVQHLAQPGDVIGQRGQWKLGGGDVVAVGLQALDDGAPTGAVGPGTMHQHDIRESIHFFTSFAQFYGLPEPSALRAKVNFDENTCRQWLKRLGKPK